MHNEKNANLCDLNDRKNELKNPIVCMKTLFNNDRGSKKLHKKFDAFLTIKSRFKIHFN